MIPSAVTDLDLRKPRHVIVTSATGNARVVASELGSNTATGVAAERVPSESSTASSGVPQSLERDLQKLFVEARYEVFEDGMSSEFACRLERVIRAHGNSALLELNALLRVPTTSKTVAAECLRIIGRLKDRQTHAFRRWILADLLNAKSVLVRDAAIVGLSSLDDPSVLASVRLALENEKSAELRFDLDQLREQLESPERGYALSFAQNP
jgi:hypothetical protein